MLSAKFPFNQALMFPGLASLVIIGGMIVPLSASADTLTEGNAISSPSRRKPGASRFDPGSFAEVSSPSRRKPGGSREMIASPSRRKPGAARLEIAALLQKNGVNKGSYRCGSEIYNLTALIPENLQGTTANSTPTVYFSLPRLSMPVDMEFVLQDGQQRVVYTETLKNQQKGGILGIKIPQSHALAENQSYHWYVSVICDAQHRERDMVVEGLIERVAPSTRESAIASSPSNLWYDNLHSVINLRFQSPESESWKGLWKSLLNSVNLGELADSPPELAVPAPSEPVMGSHS